MMPFMVGPPEEPSEEKKAEMIRAHMKRVDFHNGLQAWFMGMTAHQLWMLRILFGTIGRAGDATAAALMHEGMMIGHLQHKQGCEECGLDHLKAEIEAQAPFRQGDGTSPVGPDTPVKQPAAVYKSYGVVPLTDNPEDMRVYCNRGPRPCGMQWPTIEDRIANGGPDDCPGCQRRAAHG